MPKPEAVPAAAEIAPAAALVHPTAAAAFLVTTESHLYRMASEGRIPFVKVGRFIRYRQADLDNFVKSNLVER
jgi:excisionase family DNA binding protein